MADMHRAGRVGADEFDVDLAPLPHVRAAVAGPLKQRRADDALPFGGCKAQVQKARPRHLGRGDARIGGKAGGQRIGDVAGLLAGGLGQHHGGVGGHVAMGGIARRLDRDCGGIKARGQFARLFHLRQRTDHQRADIRKEVHRIHP